MKHARIAVLVLLIALAFAAGAAKIMKMPQEVEFFQDTIGMNAVAVVGLGVLQVLAGLLLIATRTRLGGALLLDITLVFSAVVVFMSGNISFGLISLVPVVLTSLLIMEQLAARQRGVPGRPHPAVGHGAAAARLPDGEADDLRVRGALMPHRAEGVLAVLVVRDFFEEGLGDSRRDSSVHLAQRNEWVDKRAGVVGSHDAFEPHVASEDVDLNDCHMSAEREGRSGL